VGPLSLVSRQHQPPLKYMLLIHQSTAPTPYSPDEWEKLSEDERNAIFRDYRAINETPGVSPGVQLAPPETATTVGVQDGKTLTTDGPFVEIKEAIGGYLLFEAEDLDAAIELASRIPRSGKAKAPSTAAEASGLRLSSPANRPASALMRRGLGRTSRAGTGLRPTA
jgi:hypothetical protein